MQNKNTKKIIIDEVKLKTLIRLGCSEKTIYDKIVSDIFTSQGDEVIDTLLESLTDRKIFKNWGGNHNPSGNNQYNKNRDLGQVEQRVDLGQDLGQVEQRVDLGQDLGQVVDKDKDKDKDKDINNIYNNNLNNLNNLNNFKKEKINKKEKTEEEDYRFSGSIIKLNLKDFNSWKERFKFLDNFEGLLEYRDKWLKDNPSDNWFFSTERYLEKKNKEAEEAFRENSRREARMLLGM